MKKNVLLITSDQQHWTMLGQKTPAVKTPHLDRLAQEGTTFNRAYCPNPTCTPTRSSIITGLYPSQHGAWTLGTKLDEEVRTIGDDLREAGARSALVGKAHFSPLKGTDTYHSLESYPVLQDLDFWKSYKGPFYGFDDFQLLRNHVDEPHVGQHYLIWLKEKGYEDWKSAFRKPTGTNDPQFLSWNLPEEFHYNAFIAEKTNALLDTYAKSDQAFFLWSSFPDPHPPYLVPEPWASMYDPEKIEIPEGPSLEEIERAVPWFKKTQEEDPDFSEWNETHKGIHGFHSHVKNDNPYHPGTNDEARVRKAIAVYYGMVSMMDDAIGKILDHLDKTGLSENTMVVFTSDHGHYFGQHGLVAKGAFHFEDGIKVPFITRTPGQKETGIESEALISLVDLAPTFLDFMEHDVPVRMSGLSQLEVFEGKTASRRNQVIVENRHEPTTVFLNTYIDARYKITVYWDQSYGELYDLETDPLEKNNLWDQAEAANLKSQLLLQAVHAEMDKAPPYMPRIIGA